MVAVPKLSDVQSKPGVFFPGDRILAKVASFLDKDQTKKIERAVKKFAGCDVRVLVVNFLAIEIWLTTGGRGQLLVGPEITPPDQIQLGVVNLNCTKVEFVPGDILTVRSRKKLTDLQKRVLVHQVRQWAGDEVEVSNG